MKLKLPGRIRIETVFDLSVQLLVFFYIASYFTPEHLFSKTTTTGGDTASHYYTAQYLKDYLLPHGKILGWMQGNLAGYPVFQFYFPLPFLLMALISYLAGLQIAFKIVTVLGVFLLPLSTYYGFRLLRFPFPTPSLAALFTLPFLFMEANSMWGGNILSTLAGEFTYSLGLALMVLFAGTCYRGVLENRWALPNGLLLSLVGFSHGYTLLFAVAFSTYYLLALPGLAKNIKYLAKVHGIAFCLMGFWILPLLWYSTFTTRYNFIWIINSWKDVLPTILWPHVALAAAFTLYKLVRLAWPKGREPFDDRLGLLWYILGLSFLFYLLAFRIHVVDIRFLPFLQLYLVLLAALPIGLAAARLKARWLVLVILALGTVLWTDGHVTIVKHWIDWNYGGFESKRLWPAFLGVNKALNGRSADPRVVYEHSADHNAAGTVRAFESLPLFSGRNTLEGLYMQSSLSSPFIFYIQSEVSEATSCPLPDYHCATLNLQRGADHLRLFNVRDYIVRSDAVKGAVRASPDFEFMESVPPYDIFRVKGNADRYVVPLQYQPVLLQSRDWKTDFFNWFKRPGMTAVHLVHSFDGEGEGRGRFAAIYQTLPSEIPLLPLQGEVQVSEQVGQEEILITTSKVGHPLLIKISYHPRWRVEGADRIYLTSPSFMLVFPTDKNVRLTFGDPPLVRAGQILTILAWGLFLINLKPFRPWALTLMDRAQAIGTRLASLRFSSALARTFAWYDRRRRWLAPGVIFTCALAALIIALSLQQTDVNILYNKGLTLFTKQKYADAALLFEKAIHQNPNSPSAINAYYYYAISYFKQGEWDKTRDIFSRMIDSYPESVYVPEAEYHIGLSLKNLGRSEEAHAKFRSIIARYPSSPWAGYAREQMGDRF